MLQPITAHVLKKAAFRMTDYVGPYQAVENDINNKSKFD